jgi:hypothetical protein
VLRKAMGVMLPAVATVLTAANWADIRRYMRIKELSMGLGHPEMVPVRGRVGYPQDPRRAQPDGTGEFDSALRGGPKVVSTETRRGHSRWR